MVFCWSQITTVKNRNRGWHPREKEKPGAGEHEQYNLLKLKADQGRDTEYRNRADLSTPYRSRLSFLSRTLSSGIIHLQFTHSQIFSKINTRKNSSFHSGTSGLRRAAQCLKVIPAATFLSSATQLDYTCLTIRQFQTPKIFEIRMLSKNMEITYPWHFFVMAMISLSPQSFWGADVAG